jgi:hypothetical protein
MLVAMDDMDCLGYAQCMHADAAIGNLWGTLFFVGGFATVIPVWCLKLKTLFWMV